MGVTELGHMMGTDPNRALWVLEGLDRWGSGRSAEGMDPQLKGWVRLQDRAWVTSYSSSSRSTTSGERTPPKDPKKKPRHFKSSDEEPPPPPPSPAKQAQGQGQAPGQGQGQSHPPPQNPKPPLCKIGAGTPMGMFRMCGTPGMSLGRRGAMGGP